MGVLDGLTEEELQRLCDCFVKGDINHDGFLTPEELPTFLTANFPNVDGATLDRLRNILAVQGDRNGDGRIDVREFILIVRDGALDALRNLLDTDHLGDEEYATVRAIMSRLHPDEMDMYRDAFIKLDTNGDGMLDLEEVMTGVEAVLRERFPPMRAYLEKIFEVADRDGDHMLCLREFMSSFADGPGAVPHEVIQDCTALVRVRLSDDEIARLQMAFRDMDSNQDGFLDRAELKAGLKAELAEQYPRHTDAQFDELVSVVLAAADRDRDSKLNISEFIRSFQEEQGVLPSSFMGRDDLAGGDPNLTLEQRAAAQQQQQQQQQYQQQQQQQHQQQDGIYKRGKLTKEQHDYLVRAFMEMDRDGDGVLDVAELESAVTNTVLAMVPENADQRDKIRDLVMIILSVADTNQDGVISWREFVHSFSNNSAIFEIMEDVADVAESGFHSRLTPEEVANLKSAFAALDRNGDGYVSRKELAGAVRRLTSKDAVEGAHNIRAEVVNDVVSAIMDAADADEDGKLSISEFIRAFASGNTQQIMDIGYAAAVANDVANKAKKTLNSTQVAALKEAFQLLDKNNDGYVDATELRGALFNLLKAEYGDENEVRELVAIIMSAGDTNHDGKLSLTEFIRAFVNHSELMTLSVAAADQIREMRTKILSTLSMEEIEELRAAFEQLDANHDGVLDEKEFAKAVHFIVSKKVGRAEVVPQVVALIMDAADRDRDHRISFAEFLFAMCMEPDVMGLAYEAAIAKAVVSKAKQKLSKEQVEALKGAFRDLDANHDGFVSGAELRQALSGAITKNVNFNDMSLEEAEKIIADLTAIVMRAADSNADGKLSLTEFIRAFVQQGDVMQVAAAAADSAHQDYAAQIKSKLMGDEIEMLRTMFHALDVNKDGELDKDEISNGVRQVLGASVASEGTINSIVGMIIMAADRDNNGRLSLSEFLAAFDSAPEDLGDVMTAVVGGMSQRVQTVKSKLLSSEIDALSNVFATLDLNKDGFLDADEVENAVRTVLSRGLVDEQTGHHVVKLIMEAAGSEKKADKIDLAGFLQAFEKVPQVMNITVAAADAIQAHARLLQTISKDEYEQLRVAFSVLDSNQDGFLTAEELRAAISTLVADTVQNKEVVEHVVNLVLNTASSRHDGRVTLDEFVRNFIQHHEILVAPVLAAVQEIKRRDSGDFSHGAAKSTAAQNTADAQQRNMLVPAPPNSQQQPQQQQQNRDVSVTSTSSVAISPGATSSARRRGARPGATTKELLVEASPIVNDVSGVAINDEQLRLEFELLDKSGDKRLQKSEFKKYYQSLENYGVPITDAEFEMQWKRLCGDKESTLTFERFALFMLRRSRM